MSTMEIIQVATVAYIMLGLMVELSTDTGSNNMAESTIIIALWPIILVCAIVQYILLKHNDRYGE